jgi:hypothetical protein
MIFFHLHKTKECEESSSSSSNVSKVHTRSRKEPLEQRLNAFINKHAENGMTVSSQCRSDGSVVYIIGCLGHHEKMSWTNAKHSQSCVRRL